ncbi:MAG TPA: iron-sulfur cluster repair di-iron protein [Cyclobacteriaceae bacterium]|nr:iron-sulfur cluster repair di-iron protein [Cyclobacteriaceae bacterium]HMV10545.1 iron-sulfur cluster repair di-iron protein [Cyclobacteriaceae bacterium]HMV89601.1 iron-sulfur cluster repair di-iron protein [Cyclobacteriaceae bacterium]HMW99443.1 iron-sulfur cluster repair di-iron protein [Cyclobacteriaceae bacterium]HMX48768.1 iron-sulfur cluster repair di-iron protein [Cyclobacteriaceae bacterium]
METEIKSTLEQDGLTVAQLAITHPGALAVFTKYNIDYCCGGQRSLKEACHRIGLDPDKIKAEIEETPLTGSNENFHPESWSSAFLVDYILQNHHSYVRKAIPELEPLLDRVCERHGNDCYELLQIRESFIDLAEELTSHMQKEETILFPAIKQYDDEKQPTEISGNLNVPIQVMEHEHVVAGDLVKKIRSLSNNYTPPDFACPTFRITYQRLQQFDNDLMKHIHLENNILFERFKTKQ